MKEKIFIVETKVNEVANRYYFHNREKAIILFEHLNEVYKITNNELEDKSVRVFSETYCD